MKIQLTNNFKSLAPLTLSELPDFIVLSGINGAGKTHLLQGISQNNIIKIFGDNGQELKRKKLVTSTSLAPNNSAVISWDNLKQNSQNAINQFNNFKQRLAQQPNIKLEQVIRDIKWRKLIESIAENAEKEVSELDNDDFFNHYPLEDGLTQTDVFYQNFSQLFKRYQIKLFDNDVNEFRNTKYGNVPYHSQDEFIEKYGEAPWDFVNKIIKEANLDYHINSPINQHRDAPFELKLVNNISEAEINFSELSGGEKVLMSLALSLYNSTFDLEFPEVLLMDEPDAPLHPSMTKQFLKVIENVFVKEKKVKVIITTHSPSTVALSPEDSLFQMNKTTPRISKTNRDKALKILTSGVPSLSINYENRRQVFVESKYDVYFYEKTYQKLRDYLIPEISLNFISSGVAGSGDCAQVKEVVNKLSSFGNNSIYGIIDWDLNNNGNDYIKVLGKEKRYSVENYILDPILIGAYLLREKFITREELGFSKSENFSDLTNFDDDRLQKVVDTVLNLIKPNIDGNPDETTETSLLINNKNIELPKWFLTIQGHTLEDKIKITFNHLQRFRKEGELKKEIIDKIIDDIPEILSVDLISVFKSIQNE